MNKKDKNMFDYDPRKKANQLLDFVDEGILDPAKPLRELLINYMSADDANDFADAYLDNDEDC